ncbi:hypothetical protein Sps_02182 [Shewanella psychrophila]|uniref:Lipoprotein n=1 Tax=Shewanella psychrophila TaxID=225848 RepID=A0A1S6HP95_9GAMM|nr:hypothetical protein [Shewanella psychrophila]AQS37340.1 hypothetical protein Sps_02182 [Shewanella psychrophila]
MSKLDLNFIKSGVLVTIILAATGCTSVADEAMTEEQRALKEKNEQILAESGYRCKRVKQTGSNIPIKICNTRQQRDDRKQDAQKMVDDIVNGAPPQSN